MIDLFALLEKYHLFFLFIQVIMCVNWSVYRARMRYAYKKTTQMPSGLWVFLFFFVPPEWFMGQRFGFYVDAHVGSKSLHAHRFRFKITTRHWNNTDRKHFDLNAFGFCVPVRYNKQLNCSRTQKKPFQFSTSSNWAINHKSNETVFIVEQCFFWFHIACSLQF